MAFNSGFRAVGSSPACTRGGTGGAGWCGRLGRVAGGRSSICGRFERPSAWGWSVRYSHLDLQALRYWSISFRCRLAEDFKALGLHPMSKQVASLVERSNHLRRRIANWIELQEQFMPEARITRQWDAKAKPDGIAPHKPQDIPLHFPSSYKFRIPFQHRDLWEFEFRIREGWAHDALHEMCQHLRIRTHLLQRKDKYSQGVCHNTRTNTAINKCQAKVNRATEKYRRSRDAMLALSDLLIIPDWVVTLPVLKAEDVRGLSEALMGESEGKWHPSWIWTMGVLGGGSKGALGSKKKT